MTKATITRYTLEVSEAPQDLPISTPRKFLQATAHHGRIRVWVMGPPVTTGELVHRFTMVREGKAFDYDTKSTYLGIVFMSAAEAWHVFVGPVPKESEGKLVKIDRAIREAHADPLHTRANVEEDPDREQ